jgi:fructosamine-3-kinase
MFLPRQDLAGKLARLHTDTPQDNSYKESWANFFARHRLNVVLKHCELNRGEDAKFRGLVEAVVSRVVPRLLDGQHLNNERE